MCFAILNTLCCDSEGEFDAAKRNLNPVKSISSTLQEEMALETYSNHVALDNRQPLTVCLAILLTFHSKNELDCNVEADFVP